MHVTPKEGLVVYDPDTAFEVLPPEGREVPNTQYWIRRLSDGDVVLTSTLPPVLPTPPKAAKQVASKNEAI